MGAETYERSTVLSHSLERVFAWHETAASFERFLPPSPPMALLERTGTIRDGDRATFRVGVGPLGFRGTVEYEGYRRLQEFGNRHVGGPHRSLRHRHLFRSTGEESCELTERIHCEPRPIMATLGRAWLKRTMERTLEFHQERVRRDLERHAAGPAEPLRVLVTGASGLIGGALIPFLESGGHDVVRLVRRLPESGREIAWDPASGQIDAVALEGFDAVIHLAGENIGAGRWTAARRRRIRSSRVASTELLCGALAALKRPPAALVSASAVGYYGDAAGTVDESAPAGGGFLAEVTAAWEQAAEAARTAGIRVAHARFGPVLSRKAGMLKRLLPVFRAGAGGVVGSGRQPISWIGLDDAIGVLYFLMCSDRAQGAFNVVAPRSATNREFTQALASVLRRPAFAPVPAPAIRALFGEMGDQLILKGQSVVPARLAELGFRWLEPTLDGALRWELGIQ
ncbi:MAG: TIGR01777 family oxidoreductase [Spirochaetaceae bacterium]|nr:TIGR01777 family oxidoreductase [Spirochaetaceae bacterium]